MGISVDCCPRCGNRKVEESQDGKNLFRCTECRIRFGNKEEAEEYSSKLVKFSIEIKNLSGTYLSIRINKDEGKCSFHVKTGKEKGKDGEIEASFWKEFSQRLFSEWSFHKWSESYFETGTSEGLLWDAEASFERKHTISVHGFNSRPIHWNAMIQFLSTILENCALKLRLHPSFSLEEN